MITWILLAGPPASGKSTLAGALQDRLKAIVLDKDRIRNALFPGALTDYSSEQDDLCMRAILDAAAYLTSHNRAAFIIFDGRSFSRKQQIDEVLSAAELAGAAVKILHLSCANSTAGERLRPNHQAHPARNRDMALYLKVKQSFEPIPHPKLDIDTTFGFEAQLDAIYGYLTSATL